MPNEYSADGKIILRSSDGTQMSLPRFYQLALVDGNGNYARPTSWRGHNAWDMGVAGATTVPAVTPVFGTVTGCAQTGYNGGMGTYVIIEDEKGQQHRFMHMIENSLVVSSGDSVSQGDKLGIIGNTGDSDGAHLHYDVTVNGSRIADPIDAFDCTTLPSGWNFGDAVDNGNNWDYIELDKAATDYGPPGGDTPSEPYYPDQPCHDIGWPQVSGGSLSSCIDAIAAAGHAGVIIQVGAIRSSGFEAESSFNPSDAVSEALNQNLGLGIYFYNYAPYESDSTQAFHDALAYLDTIGATKDKVKLGVWLDTEYNPQYSYDPVPNPDPSVNYAYVERFLNIFGTEYPVAGIYSSAANFEGWYGHTRIGDKPIWAAYWTGSFDTVDRSTLDYYLPEADYTKVYLMQYSDSGTVPGWSGTLDCVKVLEPMPTSGSGGGGGGGGGGEYTEVIKVTVDVKPPKRIYFNPNPGLIDSPTDLLSDRSATITLTTDADNADLYYTTDGSSPYQYSYVNGNLAYAVAANAQLYESSIIINKDTHIRVVAVPTGTGLGGSFEEPLAKGSGTYLFKYHSLIQSWEDEQKSYATSEGDVSFFEENRQAFLRLHAEQTDEEILYATTYKHDIQVVEENAEDAASGTGEATPEEGNERTTQTPTPEPEPNDEEGD